MRIVFVGPPGAGKGTQSDKLVEYVGIPHLSTGAILRKAQNEKTSVGQLAAEYMDSGRLVPDPIVVAIVGARLAEPDCQVGCLFDGFPRTVGQAMSLDDHMKTVGTPLDCVLVLRVNEEELVRRLFDRGRSDDDPNVIRKRFREYEQQTAPLLDYYSQQGILHFIDGVGDTEEVFARIKNVLDEISPPT